MPTLVEQIAAPTNSFVFHDSSGSSQALDKQPRASDAATPNIATSTAERPTRRNSLNLHSSPISNSRITTPIRANVSSVAAAD
jgi:hypothetical protein